MDLVSAGSNPARLSRLPVAEWVNAPEFVSQLLVATFKHTTLHSWRMPERTTLE